MKRTLWLYLLAACPALLFAPVALQADDEAETVVAETSTESAENDESVEDAAAKAEAEELAALRRERERLTLENAVRAERMKAEIADLQEERERLAADNALQRERLQQELAEKRLEIERLKVEMEALTTRNNIETAQRRAQLDAELNEIRLEEERLKARNALVSQQAEARLAELRLQDAEIKIQRSEMEMKLAELQGELVRRERQDQLNAQVPDSAQYSLGPFDERRLKVSDRRISLNGPITMTAADHVAERINFFNNASTEKPIFLVIDYSPGGSVMAGMKILKGMEGSRAPVYVVVKSFAASMAAGIATLAEKSFAYPNAVILHHQISWMGWGNLTQQREGLKEAERWWNRVATPIAAKMGVSLDEFIKMMYEQSSDGDWREFADDAVKLRWIDHVVDEIWETSVAKNPDVAGPQQRRITAELQERVDDKGKPYMLLPRLVPYDFYFIYNPDNYYRMP